MSKRLTPERAVLLSMLFFMVCATIWASRIPVVDGMPVSFNSDEPSHFKVIRYISEHWQLPPYTREYYESAHPPLPYVLQAIYMRPWPVEARVHALRFLSTLCGLLTILVVFRTVRLVSSEWTAAMAACFVATLPMFIMFSSSVTNDAISVLLACAIVYLIVKALRFGLGTAEFIDLCLLIGFVGVAKYTLLGLVPVAVAAVIIERRKAGLSWLAPVIGIVTSFVLISAWWYVRNQVIYGDPFRHRAEVEMAMFTGSAVPGSISYWGSVVGIMTGSLLGLYPSFPSWPESIYLTASSLFGVVAALAVFAGFTRKWNAMKWLLMGFAVSVWVVVLVYQIDHKQPHGRLLFPAIIVIAMGITGVRHLIPVEKRALVGGVSIAGLAVLSLALVLSPVI